MKYHFLAFSFFRGNLECLDFLQKTMNNIYTTGQKDTWGD